MDSNDRIFGQHEHDHGRCVDGALADAERRCRRLGLRLTPARRRVLEIVWAGHGPVKAYDILEVLNREGGRTAPPTVYRALEFLLEARLVHRLDSLNAFVGCRHAPADHEAQMLVCRRCGAVAEIRDTELRRTLERSTGRHGFLMDAQTVEILGLCPRCQDGGPH